MNARIKTACVAITFLFVIGGIANATQFRCITGSGATIDSTGNLTQGGVTYPVIYKPTTPPPTWVRIPWLSPSQLYNGTKSIGFETDPVASYANSDVDKVQLRLSSGNDSFALAPGVKRYTGFAVELGTGFYLQSGRTELIAQWWQGSPYGPPLEMSMNSDGSFQFLVRNDQTLANPSAVPINIGGGSLPIGSFATIVVMVIPSYTGAGQVKVWLNGTQIIYWTGNVGFDPAGDPYKGGSGSHPNPKFDVFFGPYRQTQYSKQQIFFNNIKFADTYADATP